MQTSEVPGAVAAGMSAASMLDLTAAEAIVLHASNRLVLRLLMEFSLRDPDGYYVTISALSAAPTRETA